MISDEMIEKAKSEVSYTLTLEEPLHEHNDCIRIAYEWLDAQKRIKNKISRSYAIKHMIEKWAGRYVSTSDVEVAAYMHPDIHGTYPYFNISVRLTEPSKERLINIPEAFTQDYHKRHCSSDYKIHE